MSAAAAVATGSAAGRYDILSPLAAGGMAEVFLARASGLGGFEKYVALKRILPKWAQDARFTRMFLAEARLAASLQHQNIAQVHDIGMSDGSYFFAMEFVHGQDARSLLTRLRETGSRLSIADAINIILHAAAGLHYAHNKVGSRGEPLKIVHRDVSPSNIMISFSGEVKVVDFGIARAATVYEETCSLKGKMRYMSPEQCKAEELDRRSDVYSLGLVLYELSTMTRVYDQASDFEVMQSIVWGDITPPSSIDPQYPRELEAIVLKALAREPSHRYPTAEAMLLDLEAFAANRKMSLSQVALRKMMGDLFGSRPEPWNVTGDGLSPEKTIIFDDADLIEVTPINAPVLRAAGPWADDVKTTKRDTDASSAEGTCPTGALPALATRSRIAPLAVLALAVLCFSGAYAVAANFIELPDRMTTSRIAAPTEEPQPVAVAQPVEPAPQPAPQPMAEPEPQPVAEPEPQPMAEPAPQPVAEPEPQPVAETAPQPAAATKKTAAKRSSSRKAKPKSRQTSKRKRTAQRLIERTF